MELLTTSLERFYKAVKDDGKIIPEPVLGRIAVCVSSCLPKASLLDEIGSIIKYMNT